MIGRSRKTEIGRVFGVFVFSSPRKFYCFYLCFRENENEIDMEGLFAGTVRFSSVYEASPVDFLFSPHKGRHSLPTACPKRWVYSVNFMNAQGLGSRESRVAGKRFSTHPQRPARALSRVSGEFCQQPSSRF